MSKRAKRRWSDEDRRFGPFTYSNDRGKRIGFTLDSGEEEHPGCCLRLHAFRRTFIIDLPPILWPHRRKVVAASWDAETIQRLGRNWYWDEHAREIGAVWIDDYVHVHYGAQTHDSSTDRTKLFRIPWLAWRHVRHSLYGLSGEHFYTQQKRQPFEDWFEIEKTCPRVSFDFDDYDGERITATTRIEEREWRLGEGWFKWISLFRRPRIRRSLDIDFSKETGPRKGSWKGGTIGHGIDMLPGELHEAAFRRYCHERKMTFVEPSPSRAPEPE